MLTVDFDRLQLAPGMIVLDAGCGRGRHSLELLQRRCQVFAMDIHLPDLRYTRYLLTATTPVTGRESTSTVTFGVVQGDALHLPFPTAGFDRIICSEMLEHVADPAQATGELTRVLKPGGVLAVSVPTPFTERLYRFGSDDYFNSPGGHIRIFTPRQLQGLLASQGLHVRDLSFAHAFHSLYWWVRCVVGLHDESHVMIRHFKKLLTYALFSPQLIRTERLFDFVFPKSMVLYARKTASKSG
jgi:SAM-dependent methyltransferase